MNSLKNRIKNGEAVHGCWLNLGSPLTAEIVASAGFDWVLIDLEHGMGTEQGVLQQLQAIKDTGATGLVRVESAEQQRILKVLDMGVAGVMCPHINNLQDANKMIDGLRYPPAGSRGIAKFTRAANYGNDFANYIKTANDNILGIAQIESAEALDHLDEIAGVDGIDVLFIGPSDLSMDLGIFGQFDNPVYTNALKAIIAVAQKAGKAVGILLATPDDYKLYYDMGIKVIACGADSSLVAEAARSLSGRLNMERSKSKN